MNESGDRPIVRRAMPAQTLVKDTRIIVEALVKDLF